jgi:hypothetical protein
MDDRDYKEQDAPHFSIHTRDRESKDQYDSRLSSFAMHPWTMYVDLHWIVDGHCSLDVTG